MSDNQREAGTIVLDPTHASFSPQEGVNDLGATHFIGIGGAGMSVLAEMLHEQGVEVDGSDREPSAKANIPSYSPAPSNPTIRKSSQHTKQANASCTAATFSHC